MKKNEYPKIIEKKIENYKLKVSSNIKVKIPSIESILGDKLTTLATKTIGISYNSGKELELMKQLYDVDKLFNEAENIEEVKESFISISTREIGYRRLKNTTYKEVLDDIEDFTNDIIYRKNKNNLEKIIVGVRKFKNFMLEKNFLIDKEVLTAASKVLYLISLIKSNKKIMEKYNKKFMEEINFEIPKEYKKRLKVINKINEECYYYIIKSLEIINQ